MKQYLLIPATALLFTTGCGVSETTEPVEAPNQVTTEQNTEEVATQGSQESVAQNPEQQEELLKGLVEKYVALTNGGEYAKIKDIAYPDSTLYKMWDSSFDGSDDGNVGTQTVASNIEVLGIDGEVAYVYAEEVQTANDPADVDLNMHYDNYYEMKKNNGEWQISIIAPDLEGSVNKDIETLKTHLQQQAAFLSELE